MPCINPIQIHSPRRLENDKKYIYVPCGKCAWCRKEKRDEWFLRFKVEQRDNKFTKFITLTYSNDNLPFYLDEESGEYGYRANKEDIQKFIKRMRKAGYKFKYFIVSEYAPETQRPHYHGLLFTDDNITDDVVRQHWHDGITDTQDADDGSLKYVTKYILKGNDRDGNIKLQSTRPAIGIGYVKHVNAMQTFQDRGDGIKTFRFPLNGKLHKMPRYYQKKFKEFLDDDEFTMNRTAMLVRMEKQNKFEHLEKNYFKNDDKTDYSPEEKFEKFMTSVHYKYHKDNELQYSINNKKFSHYASNK